MWAELGCSCHFSWCCFPPDVCAWPLMSVNCDVDANATHLPKVEWTCTLHFSIISLKFKWFVNNTCKSGHFVAVHVPVLDKAVHSMDRTPVWASRDWQWVGTRTGAVSISIPACTSDRRWCPVTHPRPDHSFQSLLLWFLGSSLATLSGQLGCVVTAGGIGPRSCAPTMVCPKGREDFSLKSSGKTQLQHWLSLPPPLQCLLIFATPISLFWANTQSLSRNSVHSIFNFQYFLV